MSEAHVEKCAEQISDVNSLTPQIPGAHTEVDDNNDLPKDEHHILNIERVLEEDKSVYDEERYSDPGLLSGQTSQSMHMFDEDQHLDEIQYCDMAEYDGCRTSVIHQQTTTDHFNNVCQAVEQSDPVSTDVQPQKPDGDDDICTDSQSDDGLVRVPEGTRRVPQYYEDEHVEPHKQHHQYYNDENERYSQRSDLRFPSVESLPITPYHFLGCITKQHLLLVIFVVQLTFTLVLSLVQPFVVAWKAKCNNINHNIKILGKSPTVINNKESEDIDHSGSTVVTCTLSILSVLAILIILIVILCTWKRAGTPERLKLLTSFAIILLISFFINITTAILVATERKALADRFTDCSVITSVGGPLSITNCVIQVVLLLSISYSVNDIIMTISRPNTNGETDSTDESVEQSASDEM